MSVPCCTETPVRKETGKLGRGKSHADVLKGVLGVSEEGRWVGRFKEKSDFLWRIWCIDCFRRGSEDKNMREFLYLLMRGLVVTSRRNSTKECSHFRIGFAEVALGAEKPTRSP